VTVTPRRAASDIAIQVVGRVFNLGLGVAVTLLVVRVLGDRGFGEWSTVLAIVQIAGYTADFGLGQVAVRHVAANPDSEARWLGALVVLRIALGVPVFGVAFIVLAVIATTNAMLVASAIVVAMGVITTPIALSSVFELRTRNGVSVAASTIQSVLWTGGAAVLYAASGAGLVAVAVLFAATTVLAEVWLLYAALREVRPKLRGVVPEMREILRVGVPIGVAGLLVTAYAKIDQVLVFQIAGERAAGLYGAAYRFLDQAQFLPSSVMTTLFPLMARAYTADRRRLERLLQVAIEVLALGSLPVLAFMIAAGHQVMGTVFGAQFAPAGTALAILMGSFVIISFGYVAGNLIIVLDEQRTFLRYAVAGLVVNVGLNLALIPHYGYVAAAWATLATDAVVTGLTLLLVSRRLEFVPAAGRLLRALGAAVAVGVGVGLGRHTVAVWVLALAATAGYSTLCIVFGAIKPRETLSLMRSARV
jgi:O-antigen/teichoic acid export membrane protein